MSTFTIGYIVGSLSERSINRRLATALIRLAPSELAFTEIPIGDLPLYNRDLDDAYPPEALALKEAIAAADGLLIVTPEYNRSIPGALKNALDWASRPWGQNSLAGVPTGVIGASPGAIGTAVAQQALRPVLAYCDAPQLYQPEAYIQVTPELITDEGEVTVESTAEFLREYLRQYAALVARIRTTAA